MFNSIDRIHFFYSLRAVRGCRHIYGDGITYFTTHHTGSNFINDDGTILLHSGLWEFSYHFGYYAFGKDRYHNFFFNILVAILDNRTHTSLNLRYFHRLAYHVHSFLLCSYPAVEFGFLFESNKEERQVHDRLEFRLDKGSAAMRLLGTGVALRCGEGFNFF